MVVYALVATTVATYRLAESAWYVHLLYFLFTGLLWVVPAMFVIRWMEGPARKKSSPETCLPVPPSDPTFTQR